MLDPDQLARRQKVMRELSRRVAITASPGPRFTEALDGMVRNLRPESERDTVGELAALCVRRLMELEP